jgi:hypothetical protein
MIKKRFQQPVPVVIDSGLYSSAIFVQNQIVQGTLSNQISTANTNTAFFTKGFARINEFV